MNFKSKLFGEQTIDPDTVLHFPEGIPGFELAKRYKLFHQEGNSIVFWLQCLDDEDVVFSVAHPAEFNINYQFVLTDAEIATLKLTNPEDILVLIMLHNDQQDPAGKPSIKGSIKSPIVINCAAKIGLQKNLRQFEQTITLVEQNNEIDVLET